MSARHHPTMMTGISLLLPITLSTMAIVLLAPVLPRMLDEFGKMANADYLVPLLLTVQAACITVFSPFAGMLGDYFGRRRLLLWAFLAYAVVGVAPVFLHDFWAIMASRGSRKAPGSCSMRSRPTATTPPLISTCMPGSSRPPRSRQLRAFCMNLA